MKHKLLQLLLFLGILLGQSIALYGQGWQIRYPYVYDEEIPTGALQTDSNEFLFVGRARDLSGVPIETYGIIFKADQNGQELYRDYNSQSSHTSHVYYALGKAANGGYLMGGSAAPSFDETQFRCYLAKYDENMNLLWEQRYLPTGNPTAQYIGYLEPTPDGGCVWTGKHNNTGWVAKVDSLGVIEWQTMLPTSSNHGEGSVIKSLPNQGGYLVLAREDASVRGINSPHNLYKLDLQGNVVWYKNHIASGDWTIMDVTKDGHLAIAFDTLTIDAGISNSDVILRKVDASNGSLLWENTYADGGPTVNNRIVRMISTLDGGFIFGMNSDQANDQVVAVRTDSSGQELWRTYIGKSNETWINRNICNTPDSGFVFFGFMDTDPYYYHGMTTTKITKDGVIHGNHISGKVYYDVNSNCNLEGTDFPLQHQLVTVTKNNLPYATAITDTAGYYRVGVNSGNFAIAHNQPSFSLYQINANCGTNPATVTIPSSNNSNFTVDFPQRSISLCPLVEVHLGTYWLRRCFQNNYTVYYCNRGSVAAVNTDITVTLDPYLIVDTLNLPMSYSMLPNNTFVFNIDTIDIGQCGSFNIPITVACDSTYLGQTHCSQVSVEFDTACINNYWSGAIIDAQTTCLGDSVQFTLTNTGSNMATTRRYWVYEDNIMLRNQVFQLGAGQSQQFKVESTGQIYRLKAQQEAGFPIFFGDTITQSFVYECDDIDTTGILLTLPNYDGSPFLDIDCQHNIGSYDPNDKRGFPTGVGAAHYITKNTPLDYNIRFQNTGTDTAFTVVIVDTLDAALDIRTLRLGASSHAYTLDLGTYNSNQSILTFTFNNIMLPDSNVNEPLSHGFIQFSIDQQANNPLGTVIENQAAIYFDFNAPIFTNTTWHTVGENFIQLVDVQVIDQDILSVKVMPNPFRDQATIAVEEWRTGTLELQVYDMIGQQAGHYQSSTGRFDIQRGHLESGMYVFRIMKDGQLKTTGKFIIQ